MILHFPCSCSPFPISSLPLLLPTSPYTRFIYYKMPISQYKRATSIILSLVSMLVSISGASLRKMSWQRITFLKWILSCICYWFFFVFFTHHKTNFSAVFLVNRNRSRCQFVSIDKYAQHMPARATIITKIRQTLLKPQSSLWCNADPKWLP